MILFLLYFSLYIAAIIVGFRMLPKTKEEGERILNWKEKFVFLGSFAWFITSQMLWIQIVVDKSIEWWNL